MGRQGEGSSEILQTGFNVVAVPSCPLQSRWRELICRAWRFVRIKRGLSGLGRHSSMRTNARAQQQPLRIIHRSVTIPGAENANFLPVNRAAVGQPSWLPVSGGVGPSNPVKRKEGDLTVRALVLADGNTKVAIVSADFLGFPSVLGDQARAKVKGIPPQNILIGATHTHSAPDCYGFPDHEGRFAMDLKYVDFVCNQIADAVNEAVARLQPAGLKIATDEAKGKIAFNYYAEQLYDPRCHVIH